MKEVLHKTNITDSEVEGVIGGIAKYYKFNPLYLRIAATLAFLGEPISVIIIYYALFVSMPDEIIDKKVRYNL